MLHAIHIHRRPDISPLAPFAGPPRLATSQVQAQTVIRHSGDICERYLGALSWIEHAELASLEARVEFINRLCDRVEEVVIERGRPLTLVSLGPGGLLTEALIHDQLQQAGYTDIRWRIIDLNYMDGGFRAPRLAFAQRVGEKVAAFTTEQAYLNKEVGGDRLAMRDRAAGTSIILCIDPPSSPGMLARIAPDASGGTVIGVRGRVMQDVTKANAVALYIGLTPQQTQEALSGMYRQICWTNGLLRLYIEGGNIAVDAADGEMGNELQRMIRPHIAQVVASVPAGQAVGLSHAHRAAASLAQALESIGEPAVHTYVSDYDVACTHLRAHFADSPRTVFACLSYNRSWILDR
ncbi:hypothetical protein CURE108131_22655 [Cupriavidus respiraculi]|uniref:Uncharacterized protein n=1 Tax=Cupriavidus respiraculi TaxID=195930 RepID=A0ABN7YK75_9BURK|nr:hypothetical protein [Cupriavidus respiraculi]CAG9172771.1 hypothetical protein LMG21510_02064 [Cupriavidus respiraculi]